MYFALFAKQSIRDLLSHQIPRKTIATRQKTYINLFIEKDCFVVTCLDKLEKLMFFKTQLFLMDLKGSILYSIKV